MLNWGSSALQSADSAWDMNSKVFREEWPTSQTRLSNYTLKHQTGWNESQQQRSQMFYRNFVFLIALTTSYPPKRTLCFQIANQIHTSLLVLAQLLAQLLEALLLLGLDLLAILHSRLLRVIAELFLLGLYQLDVLLLRVGRGKAGLDFLLPSVIFVFALRWPFCQLWNYSGGRWKAYREVKGSGLLCGGEIGLVGDLEVGVALGRYVSMPKLYEYAHSHSYQKQIVVGYDALDLLKLKSRELELWRYTHDGDGRR